MKENFPSLAKEIEFQEIQEAQRVPKKLDPRRNTPRHIIIKLPKIKDKERVLKAAREKKLVTCKRVTIDGQLISPKKPCRLEGLVISILSHDNQEPTAKIVLPSKAIIQNLTNLEISF